MWKKFLTITIFILIYTVSAKSDVLFDVESGLSFNKINDIGIPGNTGTRFSAVDDMDEKIKPFFRFRVTGRINNKHNISALASLLYAKSDAVFANNILFNGQTFVSGVNTTLNYKFNNYRLTYRYDFVSESDIRFGAGLTLFVREAYIEMENNLVKTRNSNVGFVPLINLNFEWFFVSWFGIFLEADFLFSKQGRAEDISIAFLFKVHNDVTLRLGYRLIEGGADNDKVYNFALFHFLSFAVNIKINTSN